MEHNNTRADSLNPPAGTMSRLSADTILILPILPSALVTLLSLDDDPWKALYRITASLLAWVATALWFLGRHFTYSSAEVSDVAPIPWSRGLAYLILAPAAMVGAATAFDGDWKWTLTRVISIGTLILLLVGLESQSHD